MTVHFPDGTNHSMWRLMEAIPGMLGEMLPKKATNDSELLGETLEKLNLVVTGSKSFTLHAKPGHIVEISNRTLEFFWLFTYLHTVIYMKYFAGEQKPAGVVDVEDDKELDQPRAMWAWMQSAGARLGYEDYPAGFPIPNPNVAPESAEGVAYHLVHHVIRFILLHEFSHVAYEIKGDTPDDILVEEANCDKRALAWMQFRNPETEADNRRTKTGSAIALLFVAAVGISTGNYDGVTHPLAYHRPIDTLRTVYGIKQHGVWGLCFAVLVLHCINVGMKVSWDEKGYDEFRDAVQAIKEHIDELEAKKKS